MTPVRIVLNWLIHDSRQCYITNLGAYSALRFLSGVCTLLTAALLKSSAKIRSALVWIFLYLILAPHDFTIKVSSISSKFRNFAVAMHVWHIEKKTMLISFSNAMILFKNFCMYNMFKYRLHLQSQWKIMEIYFMVFLEKRRVKSIICFLSHQKISILNEIIAGQSSALMYNSIACDFQSRLPTIFWTSKPLLPHFLSNHPETLRMCSRHKNKFIRWSKFWFTP